MVALHKYDVNYVIMQGNMTMMKHVIINGTVERCMAMYLEWLWKCHNRYVWWLF